MNKKILFIFVEGPDDFRFFNEKIKPIIEKNSKLFVQLIKYSEKTKKYINSLISIIKIQKHPYIFTADINNSPCITSKKLNIHSRYQSVDCKYILIVIKEIESWYLAGINESSCKHWKLSPIKSTDDVTKEKFNKLIPKIFNSRVDFMIEILKCFSFEIAKKKNKSFSYFYNKYKNLLII